MSWIYTINSCIIRVLSESDAEPEIPSVPTLLQPRNLTLIPSTSTSPTKRTASFEKFEVSPSKKILEHCQQTKWEKNQVAMHSV
jgi:hypothetical protein